METLVKVEIRDSEVSEIRNKISAQLCAQSLSKLHKIRKNSYLKLVSKIE